jgi:hypothetical protein
MFSYFLTFSTINLIRITEACSVLVINSKVTDYYLASIVREKLNFIQYNQLATANS